MTEIVLIFSFVLILSSVWLVQLIFLDFVEGLFGLIEVLLLLTTFLVVLFIVSLVLLVSLLLTITLRLFPLLFLFHMLPFLFACLTFLFFIVRSPTLIQVIVSDFLSIKLDSRVFVIGVSKVRIVHVWVAFPRFNHWSRP